MALLSLRECFVKSSPAIIHDTRSVGKIDLLAEAAADIKSPIQISNDTSEKMPFQENDATSFADSKRCHAPLETVSTLVSHESGIR